MRTIRRKLEITPAFHQTDMMGVIHNSQYFLWFEEGRLQLMQELLTINDAMNLGYVTPVIENICHYKRFVKYGDPLVLVTKHEILSSYNGRLEFEHSLVHKTSKVEMATGKTVLTIVDYHSHKLIKEWPLDLWEKYSAMQ